MPRDAILKCIDSQMVVVCAHIFENFDITLVLIPFISQFLRKINFFFNLGMVKNVGTYLKCVETLNEGGVCLSLSFESFSFKTFL